MNNEGFVIDLQAEHRGNLLSAGDFTENSWVVGDQGEAVDRVRLKSQATVARHGLGDINEKCVWDCKAGVLEQGIDYLFGIQTRSARIPKSKRC